MIDPDAPSGKKHGAFRIAVGIVAIALVAMPIAFVLTIALMPLWSFVERHWGIESVGHSGPANWCFWLVYAACVVTGLAIMVAARRGGPSRD